MNDANLILPAGDVQIGPLDYNIYTNSQLSNVKEINRLPLKMVGQNPVTVADIGSAKDAKQIQTNLVRVDGQKSVYIAVLKQGGDTNTIAVVDGVKNAVKHLYDVPKELISSVVFDQSVFVKTAIETLLHEGGLGLVLTSVMILVFLGSMRATVAVFFSIPLSALATFIALQIGGSSINSMVLGGLALAFSRLIDNSVVVLENIYRHLEMGEPPQGGGGKGRPGSCAASAGGDTDHGGGVLPGHVSVRREQVPLFRRWRWRWQFRCSHLTRWRSRWCRCFAPALSNMRMDTTMWKKPSSTSLRDSARASMAGSTGSSKRC